MENNDNSVTEAQILKRSDPQYVFSFITRDLNLINDGNKVVKINTIPINLFSVKVFCPKTLQPNCYLFIFIFLFVFF